MKNKIFKTENFLIKALHKVERITNTIHTLVFEDDAKFPNPAIADLTAQDVETKIEDLGSRLISLNGECTRSQKFDEDTQQKIQDLQNTLEGLKTTISNDHTEEDIQAATAGLKDLRAFFDNKQQEVENKLQDMQAQLQVIKEAIEEDATQDANVKEDIIDIKNNINALTQELQKDEATDVVLAKGFQACQEGLVTLQSTAASTQTDIAVLQADVLTIQNEVSTLKATANNHDAAIAQINKLLADLNIIPATAPDATLAAIDTCANSVDIAGADAIAGQ